MSYTIHTISLISSQVTDHLHYGSAKNKHFRLAVSIIRAEVTLKFTAILRTQRKSLKCRLLAQP
jgi:hypothetical protein